MKKRHVSEEAQWDILDCLFKIHPQRLTDNEVKKQFGDPEDAVLIANVRQLISEGLVEQYAVIKKMTRETLFPSALRLTPSGVNLMQNAKSED